MAQRDGLFDTITDAFVPVHSDGWKFIGIGAVAAIIFLLLWPPLGWLLVLITAWIAYFFRDPDRVTPLREGLVVAAGDGRVSAIEKVRPPQELGLGDEPRVRISIFLSVFDVHINRSPIAGKVTRVKYHPGEFLPAWDDKASLRNEQNAVTVEDAGTSVEFKQIAGLIARRIVFKKREGDAVAAGERVGMIKFGSRVDVFLPASIKVRVQKGERVRGGVSVLGERAS